MRGKVGKSRNTMFFQWFVAPEGRKVGSLKRRLRSQLARWVMKIARRCGAKHISKWKCTKHTRCGPLLAAEMSKKCTPLWRERHFEVKMLKTLGVRTTFGGSDVASLRFASLHYITLHYTPLHYTTLHYTPLHSTTLHNYTPLHSTTPTTRHYTKLHYTTLHYITLHYTPLHYITLHYTTLPSTTLHYTPLHSSTLQLRNYTPLH